MSNTDQSPAFLSTLTLLQQHSLRFVEPTESTNTPSLKVGEEPKLKDTAKMDEVIADFNTFLRDNNMK